MHRCFSWGRRQTDRTIQFDLEKMWKGLTDRVGGHKFNLNELKLIRIFNIKIDLLLGPSRDSPL